MNANDDQPTDDPHDRDTMSGRVPEQASEDLNPYAVPIQDEIAQAVAIGQPAPFDQPDSIDLPAFTRQARFFALAGVVLAVLLFASIYFGGLVGAGAICLLQIAWVIPALRLSSKYGRFLPTGLRIGFRVVLVFHVVVLALEVAAVLLLATCFAIISSAGN
ncbi:hypothetical protein [Planctomycetes bacterium K23_9]|uniref:Uncharacterized protein n=1 Tax=Stieleria marina TaxID=1930275 RepID=A0A517NXE0_9BACT|nr:hypothetical protein K239x_38020 [Planctomycetes bacterium K23_9]